MVSSSLSLNKLVGILDSVILLMGPSGAFFLFWLLCSLDQWFLIDSFLVSSVNSPLLLELIVLLITNYVVISTMVTNCTLFGFTHRTHTTLYQCCRNFFDFFTLFELKFSWYYLNSTYMLEIFPIFLSTSLSVGKFFHFFILPDICEN